MIKLYGLSPAWGLPDCSQFVLKVDCYLRMIGMPHQLISWQSLKDFARAPKGKVPFIEDGMRTVADSGFIIKYLQENYGDKLGENRMSLQDRAIALAMCRLIEEHLYWAIMYERWMEDSAWEAFKPILFGAFELEEFRTLPDQFREGMRHYLHGHGLGRHSRMEVYDLGNADISALSAYLADKPYFMGKEPSSLDAAAYGCLAQILYVGYPSSLNTHAKAFSNIQGFCDRIRKRYYAAALSRD